jgi:hypothetical protein
LNSLVEDPGNCLLYSGYPPGISFDDVKLHFKDYRLRNSRIDPAIKFNASGRIAVIEFENRNEAHRAFKDLCRARQLGPTDDFFANLTLLQ